MTWETTEFYGPTPEQIHERRRYEIARDVMASLYADGPNVDSMPPHEFIHSDLAKAAVMAADALLAELEAKR